MALRAEVDQLGTDQPQMQKRRCGAGAAVEHERHRPVRRVAAAGHIGGIEDLGLALAGLIDQREGAGRRRVGELAGGKLDRVLTDRIARQQPQDAGAVLRLVALRTGGRTSGLLFGDGRRSKHRQGEGEREDAPGHHERRRRDFLPVAGIADRGRR